MGRPSNRAARRLQIVSALIRLLPKQGYKGTSIAALAKEAGLTPGLIHYHFKTKKEILIAAIELMETGLVDRVSVRREAHPEELALDSILFALLGTGDGAKPDQMKCWLTFAHEAMQHDDVAVVYERTLGTLRLKLVESVSLARQLHAPAKYALTPEELAALLLSTIQGMFQVGIVAPEYLAGQGFELCRASAHALLMQRSET